MTCVATVVHHNMGCGGIPIRPPRMLGPFSAKLWAHTLLGLYPEGSGTAWSPPTTGRQPPLPGPPTAPCREGWPARGRFSPSCAWQPPRLHHPRERPGAGQNRRNVKQTREWCPPPVGRLRTKAARLLRSRFVFCPRDLDLPSQNLGPWHLRPLCPLPPCRCEPQRSPLRTPAAPRLLPSRTQLGGGQNGREDGHTDTDVRREGGGGGDGAEGGLGTMATQSECERLTGPRTRSCQPEGHSGTAIGLVHSL